MSPKQPSQGIKVVYVVGLLFGIGIICWQAAQLQREKASLLWPMVTGKILASELVYVSSHDRADVTYNYVVNGTRQVSHQISLWSSDLSSYGSITRAFVANHTNGAPVDVYYDPGQPENAVLIPGTDENMHWLLMGMGGFSAFTSIFGLIARLRKEPRLHALLNDPAAETRTITMNKADIIRGSSAFGIHVLFGGLTLILTVAFSLVP
ncbi:MAG: DUF3592 domain-containing protein, partial [Verrucomicrobia bacterium]|nr:DUF3592 domain-containing protein [Verrucomicrobiota bacterium]